MTLNVDVKQRGVLVKINKNLFNAIKSVLKIIWAILMVFYRHGFYIGSFCYILLDDYILAVICMVIGTGFSIREYLEFKMNPKSKKKVNRKIINDRINNKAAEYHTSDNCAKSFIEGCDFILTMEDI